MRKIGEREAQYMWQKAIHLTFQFDFKPRFTWDRPTIE